MKTITELPVTKPILVVLYELAENEQPESKQEHVMIMSRLLSDAMAFWLEQPVAGPLPGLPVKGDRVTFEFDLAEDLLGDFQALATLERKPEEPDNFAALGRVVDAAAWCWLSQSILECAPGGRLQLDPRRPRPEPRWFDDLPEDPDQ